MVFAEEWMPRGAGMRSRSAGDCCNILAQTNTALESFQMSWPATQTSPRTTTFLVTEKSQPRVPESAVNPQHRSDTKCSTWWLQKGNQIAQREEHSRS